MNGDEEDEEEILNDSIEDLVNSIFLTANFRRFLNTLTDDVMEEIISESIRDLENDYNYYYNYGSFGTTEAVEQEEKKEIEFTTSKYSIDKNTVKECSICLLDFEEDDDIVDLTCTHIFHKNCIIEWCHVKAECPNCREHIC
jgi:hypothetical protein